jgi:PAS domain S-box-containing protein
VRWLGTNTDVHAQRTAAAELASMNAALEQRVEERTRDRERMWRLSTDLMLVADGDGRIGTVNPAWLMLLGWPNDQVSQRRLIDFAHADDRSQLELAMAPLGARGGVARFEGRFMHIDGSFRWIAWTAVSDGQHMHAAGRDITANKTASIALAQAEEALRQAQKMEAVGQLTGGIAHDFNNLLQGITGSLDLIRTRIAQDRHEDVARFVTSAMASANRATALTHRLLAFSRRQPLSPKVVRLNDLAVSLEELIRRTIGEGVELTFALSDNLWPTLCDPNQMESSLLNLVINARDAMPDGGRLTIKTENVDCTLPLPTGSRELKPGRYVCLRVSDTGMGMPPDVIERAFDPFFTTKPIGQGTGLGLSMIYGFAQQSEGAVHIESAVGAGTTVSIYLPKCDASEVPMSAEPGPAEPSHRAAGGAVVLVIEDEPIVRALVLDVLQEMGYQTIEAADGPSGLQLLQSRQRVDLLVTDIGLPGLNGRQVADAARLTRPDLKVLFMTGYAENAAYARGFLEAGMSMITKPFTLDTLELTVQEIMTAKVA